MQLIENDRTRRCGFLRRLPHLVVAVTLLVPLAGHAQIVPTWREEYEKRLKYGDLVEPMKGDIFGEKVNLYDGSMSLSATDLSVPGNNGLAVSISRSYGDMSGNSNDNEFGNWSLDIPSLSGTYGDQPETEVEGYWSPSARCSTVTAPPTLGVWNYTHSQIINFDPHTYWDGVRLTLAGGRGETVLAGSGDPRQPVPQVGQATPWNTKSGWFFSCLGALKSGQPGQGFLGHSPDGTKYYFDWMVVRNNEPATLQPDGIISHAILKRKKVFLYPSQVVDRFGNWVRYEWSAGRLDRIVASDGRSITLAYDAQGRISTASTANRSWTYGYSAGGLLQSVTLPDGTSWNYNLPSVAVTKKYPEYTGQNPAEYIDNPAMCAKTNKIVQTEVTATITHPSGAVGTFAFRPFRHGRKNVPFNCQTSGDDQLLADGWNLTPIYRDAMSLVTKTISGPGMSTAQWTYQYTNLGGQYDRNVNAEGWPIYPVGQSEPKITIETGPDGVLRTYEFGKEVAYNDGLLLATTTSVGGTVVRVDRNNYYPDAQLASAPFPREAGRNLKYGATELGEHLNRPVQGKVVSQDGVQFTRQVQTFDSSVREIDVVESNSSGQSRTSSTQYYDNPQLWVRGQTLNTVSNGIEVARTEFDGNTALPVRAYSFGRLAQQVSYAADGTVATATDGRGNTSYLSSWKRGIPQLLRYPPTPEAPNGATRQVEVDDNGWITALTDEVGAITRYGYDGLGRLISTQFPTGDSVAWNAASLGLERLGAAEFGVPAGAWKHSRTLGGQRTDTYLDAMFRPVLVTQNLNNVLDSAVVTRYDSSGRAVFASYPTRQLSSVAQALPGTTTQYDALGRPVVMRQTSELGDLVNVTEYIGDLSVRTTNARGLATVTRHLAYDEPSYESPLVIQHPEGVVTEIQRDTLGKPLAITRRNSDGSQSLTRRYVYDSHQQLCKTIEPETGAAVQDYDAAGNVAWSVAGTGLTSAADCNRPEALAMARAIVRSYDGANRLSQLSFPDARGDQSWTYTPDGLPNEVTTQNEPGRLPVVNRYQYNRRRLLTAETMQHGDLGTVSFAYSYDANGSLAGHTYPDGRGVAYAPDPLGRSTAVGGYAQQASYHANGALAGFIYGNGIAHSLAQNARGLPERSRDASAAFAVHDDSYDYDAAGNVLAISDGLPGAPGNRDMAYDGLDRLRTVTAPSFGNALYEYDALDNLRRAKVGSRDRTHYFDPANRLVNVMDTGGGATVIGLAYDAQGNLAVRNGQVFAFDYGNRLRAVSGAESYEYDAHGRRVKSLSAAGGAIYSFYDNAGVLRFQRNERTGRQTDYLYLSGSLVAQVYGSAAPSIPVLSAPGYITQGSVSLSWTPAGGADRYELQQGTGGNWAALYDGNALGYAVSGLQTGTYQYRVRGCRAVCGDWSNTASVAVELPPSSVPGLSLAGVAYNGNYAVSWSGSPGATAYQLEESANGGGWVLIHNAAPLSVSINGKPAGGYSYRVRACNPIGCTGYSAAASVTVVYPPEAAPGLSLPSRSGPGSIGIGWNGIGGADRYTLQESANGAGWTTLLDAHAISYATPYRGVGNYAYRVAACNGAGCGGWSVTASVAVIGPPGIEPVITAPGLVNVPNYSISWSVPANTESFVLQESANGGGWTTVQGGASNSFGAGRGNGSYAYRVQACNFVGCSPFSGIATVTVSLPPETPAFYVATWLTTKRAPYQVWCEAGWHPVANATEYHLETDTGGKRLYTGPLAYVAAAGNAYCSAMVRVRACNAGGCSAWSPNYTATRGVYEVD